VSTTERILYGLAWHLRHGDPAARDDLAGMLSEDERAEARAVLALPGVAETLQGLTDDELRARMLSLAGKSKEIPVKQHEPTTILSGAPGVPTVVVRDHDGWQAQVAAENRARVDEQIKATVADIERGEQERRYARPLSAGELEDGMRANAALHRDRAETPGRIAAQLDATEALVTAMMADVPPPPDAAGAAWQQANEYSYGLAATMARLRGMTP
jgi:hypothetical protein